MQTIIFFIAGLFSGALCGYYGHKHGEASLANKLLNDLTSEQFQDALQKESLTQTKKGTKQDAFIKGAYFVISNLIDADVLDDIEVEEHEKG